MKIIYRITGILFAVFVLTLTVLFLILPDGTYSASEKRNLAKLPELNLSTLTDGSFMDSVEDYTADQFPKRSGWMTLKTALNRLLGKDESQGVYLCAEDTLIQRFTAPEAASVTGTAEAVNAFAARHPESAFYFMTVPTAVTVYPELLPDNAPTDSEYAYMTALNNAFSGDIRVIDVTNTFFSRKNQVQLYYRTDHHWTTEGAREAYLCAAERMKLSADRTYRSGIVHNSFLGSLCSESGFSVRTPDSISVYLPETEGREDESLYTVLYPTEALRSASCYETEKLAGDDPYQVFFGGNHPLMEIETSVDTDRTLLVIKDSYANCFLPFLLGDYHRITVVDPRYYYEDIDILAASGAFTEVLFLYNASTLAADTSLRTVLNNQQ